MEFWRQGYISGIDSSNFLPVALGGKARELEVDLRHATMFSTRREELLRSGKGNNLICGDGNWKRLVEEKGGVMRRKRILLSGYVGDNIPVLHGYYRTKLEPIIGVGVDVECYMAKNLKSLKHKLARLRQFTRAYDVVVSDYPTRLFQNAKVGIYIFHGALTKKHPGNEEIRDAKVMSIYRILRKHAKYIVCCNHNEAKYYLQHQLLNSLPIPQFVPLGLPRNDLLLEKEFVFESKKYIYEKLRIDQRKRLLLYAPTYRGYPQSDIKRQPFSDDELRCLDVTMERLNMVFVYRPHYIDSLLPENKLHRLKSFRVCDQMVEPSTQRLLAATDVLLTDYSSIFVDFLLLDRPIIFYPYDWREYTFFRGTILRFDSGDNIPGRVAETVSELVKAIEDECYRDGYVDVRKRMKTQWIEYATGSSTERVWKLILQEAQI